MTNGKMNRKALVSGRTFGLLIVAAMGSTYCATIDRGASRTTLSVDFEGGAAGNKTYGCGGELLTAQKDAQIGGQVELRHESRKGFHTTAKVGGLYGANQSTYGFEPVRRDYGIGIIGGTAGFDTKYVGFDLGFNLAVNNLGGALIAPRFVLRLGNPQRFFWENGIGMDGPFDGRMAWTGFGLRGSRVRLDVGVAVIAKAIVDLSDCSRSLQLGLLSHNGGSEDLGGYLLLQLPLSERFGLDLGFIGAESYSVRLGLRIEL
jgi:hypothetical protein